MSQGSAVKVEIHATNETSHVSRLCDHGLTKRKRTQRLVHMATDNQPDLRESGRNALFLRRRQVRRKNDEIGLPTHFGQNLLEGFHDIDSSDTLQISWMGGGHNFFRRNADNSETDPFDAHELI